jgi:transcriptional regulator GlxA family with amidase domain
LDRESVRRSRLDYVTDWETRAERASWRVGALARDCGVSERHLRRFFLDRFQMSPRAWLATKQLARGAASLQQARLVKEAAGQAGFDDPAHFSRSFTQQYGVPPSAFRSGFAD